MFEETGRVMFSFNSVVKDTREGEKYTDYPPKVKSHSVFVF
jgi:hypothetical protein